MLFELWYGSNTGFVTSKDQRRCGKCQSCHSEAVVCLQKVASVIYKIYYLWTPLLPRCVSLLAAEMRYKLLMNEKRIQDKRKIPEEGEEAPVGTDEGKSKSKKAKQPKKATENPDEKTQAAKEKKQKKEKKNKTD